MPHSKTHAAKNAPKGATETVTIDRLAFRGEGVGRLQRAEGQKVVFVPYAVPGDVLKIQVTESHKNFDRGVIASVVSPSVSRVDAPCPYFGKCGGCHWQHIAYGEQVKAKEEIFRQTLYRVAKIAEPKVLPILSAANPWNYRQRIQLKVDFSQKAQVGFFAPESHDVVPIEKCDIADPKINEVLQSLLKQGQIPTRPFEISVFENGDVHVLPMDHVDRYFSQAHPEQNRQMIHTVLHFVFGRAESAFKVRRTLLELYAGSGNFTFPLAEHAGRVIAVEENAKAVKVGERLAEERGLTHVEWVTGTVEWGTKKVLRKRIPVDTVVLDPPRAGASDVLDLLMLLKPKTIVYVSCDPNTLARDVRELTKRFYRFDVSQPIDMFPQTYHIESVTKLRLV